MKDDIELKPIVHAMHKLDLNLFPRNGKVDMRNVIICKGRLRQAIKNYDYNGSLLYVLSKTQPFIYQSCEILMKCADEKIKSHLNNITVKSDHETGLLY